MSDFTIRTCNFEVIRSTIMSTQTFSSTQNEARQAAQNYLNSRLKKGGSEKQTAPFTIPEINRPLREQPRRPTREQLHRPPPVQPNGRADERRALPTSEHSEERSPEQPDGLPPDQSGETSTMPTDEEGVKEQDRLPSELHRFVISNGYLDYKRVLQPSLVECVFAGCLGTVSRLPELATHIIASYYLARWPNAPTTRPVKAKDKSLCTAALLDRAVCPFAASNRLCTNLD